MIRIGSFKVYLNTDIYGWCMTGIGWGATWFFGFSIAKPDECREAYQPDAAGYHQIELEE